MVDACAWKSDKHLVPQDQLGELLSSLLEAEKQRWLTSISPVNSSAHDDSLEPERNGKRNSSFIDAGLHLLRHGKCVHQIHSYFHRLEPNHYCLKATTNDKNPDRPSSQIKVVSNDDSLTDSTRTAASTESITLQETGGVFTHRHPSFELYKNALLCAKYPVLSVSQPASPNVPYSPALSPSISQRKFSFSKVPNPSSVPSNTSDSYSKSASCDGCISPEVSLPISSDALQQLVMNVFALTKKQHKYFCGTIIPEKIPQAKDPQRLLVETLLSQQVVLERNHHPFYSVQAFMDKNAYSEWVITEKEKIDCLIRSFWHNACPPVPELPLKDHEFHKQYVDLMKRLIWCESKNKQPHPVHGGVTPTHPLSSQACRLLKEFQLRYGVGLLFCKISYLDYLVKYLENEPWYIHHVTSCLQDVMEHVTYPEIFVESVFKMLLSILSDLLGKTKYALTRIRKIFPENSPTDGVPALVTLFKLSSESGRQLQSEFPMVFSTLHQAQLFACNLATEPFGDILASFSKTEMEGRYERLKVIATDELDQDFLSPRLLIKLILEIRKEAKDYHTFYSMAFSGYFDMMELAAVQFYSLLMSDVEQLCANPRGACKRGDAEPNMLCLAFRLSKLDKDWAKFIPFSHQIWRQPFQEFALQWLDAIGHSFQTLVPQLTCHDTWTAAEVNFTLPQKRHHKMSKARPAAQRPMGARSVSLQSLMHSQHSAFNTVSPSRSAPLKVMKSEGMANGMKRKQHAQSGKCPLGSCPIPRARSPERRRSHIPHESSSEEDTTSMQRAYRSRPPSKANHVHQVIAQVHEPKAKAGPGAKVKNLQQRSRQGGNSKRVASIAHAHEGSKDGSPTGLEVKPETRQSSSDFGQVLPTASNPGSSSKSQDRPGNIEEIVQITKCGEPGDHESQTEHKGKRHTLTTVDSHDSVKHDSSEHGNGNKCETSSEKPEDDKKVPKTEKSYYDFEPDSIGHSVSSEQSQHAFKVDDNDTDKAEQSDIPSQSGDTEVHPYVREDKLNDTGITPGFSLDYPKERKEKTVKTSASITSSETKCVCQLPGNGGHSEDEQVESAGKIESQSYTSVCNKNMTCENVEVGLSDCPGHSRGSSTPFENDSTGESDSDTLMHSSEMQREASVDVPSVVSSSLPDSHQQEPQEDNNTRGSNPNPVPKFVFVSIAQAIDPVEDGGIGSEGQSTSDLRESCPTKDICVTKDKTSPCDVEGEGSNDPRAVQQSKSAPINIPPTRPNKLIVRLLDTPAGSIDSTLSGCFVSASGSVRSGTSIESFHTARSKDSSSHSQHARDKENSDDQTDTPCASQVGQSTISDDSGDHTRKIQPANDAPQVLPISSSFVDLLCAVNRLVSFVCHLCKILCPDESLQTDEYVDDELRNEALRIKRRLCNRLIEVILSFVMLYSDNVLAMETCGLPEDLLTEILDDQVQRHLKLQQQAGHLRGCRYNPAARQGCNTKDSNGMFIPPCEGMSRTETNPGQYEPPTQQMGVRISNVAILRSILPWLSEHATAAVNNHDSLLSAHHCYVSSTESEVSYSLSYCECGPSLDGVTNNTAAEAAKCNVAQPRTDELHDQRKRKDELEHFCRLETAQVKLVTYRINKFFKQVLQHLLDLNLPRYGIRRRLRPAREFLSRELRRFHDVMYPDCFKKLLTDIWTAVAENFKEELSRLVRRRSSASEHSKLLLQAVACLMQFFHAEGIGLDHDEMAAPLEVTVKHLQLYTSPTDRLISMYDSLYKQVLIMQRLCQVDEMTSSVSVSSHQASANAPADSVLQAMRNDLHTTRKCFTGVQLVEWVKDYVRNHDIEDLGVCFGSTETKTGLELGQYLLEQGMIICVSPPPLFNQQMPSVGRGKDAAVFVDNVPAERGMVFINDTPAPDSTINNITVTTRNSNGSPLRSTSHSSSVDDSESQDEADDEYEHDDDDFLGSGSDLWTRANSLLSERNATFYNHHKAFYKFVCEEDSSRTGIKISLGITDRLNLQGDLKGILCVLHARRDSDKSARNFLKRLPRQLLYEAVGRETEFTCFSNLRVCQTS